MTKFFDRLEKHGRYGCWEFVGWRNEDGYGRTSVGTRRPLAHRLAYELAVGPIGEGLEIDHLCANRACCNPSHLEPVDHATNIRRGESGKYLADKTTCPQDHAYDEANTYVDKRGCRYCKTCMREYGRRYKAKKRARA